MQNVKSVSYIREIVDVVPGALAN